jgi:hypothetical protein
MGKSSCDITANIISEDSGPGSREAHHVGSRAQEDRSVSAGTVGKNKSSAEEGCLMEEWSPWKRTMFH